VVLAYCEQLQGPVSAEGHYRLNGINLLWTFTGFCVSWCHL